MNRKSLAKIGVLLFSLSLIFLFSDIAFASAIISTTGSSTVTFTSSGRNICRTTNAIHVLDNTLYYNSTDGISWRPSFTLDGSSSLDNPLTANYPTIACSGSKVFTIWTNNTGGFFYRNSSDEGVTWSSLINNHAPIWTTFSLDAGKHPSISWGSEDNVYVVLSNTTRMNISNSSSYGGDYPSLTQNILSSSTVHSSRGIPSIGINGSEEIWVAYLDYRRNITFNYSTNSGNSWNGTEINENLDYQSLNFYQFNNTFFIAIVDATDLYLYNTTNPSLWGVGVRIDVNDNNITGNPTLTSDKNNLYLFWSQNDTGNENWNIFYRKWNITNGWDNSIKWQNSNSSYINMSSKYGYSSNKIDVIWKNSTSGATPSLMYDFLNAIELVEPVTSLFRNSTNEITNNNMTGNYTMGINITGYSSGTTSIFKNGTDISSQNNTIVFYGVGVYEIKANSTDNGTGTTNYLTVRQMFPNASIYLNGTINSNMNVSNNTFVNVTGLSNTSQIHSILNYSGNYTFDLRETDTINQRFENVTKFFNESDRVINITIYTDGNNNWTSGSITRNIYLDVTNPNIRQFSLNDTYMNINETTILSVNVTDSFTNISKVLVEVQSSGGKNNRSAVWNNTHYILTLNKTWLGVLQNNASLINITNIFVNDSVNNFQVNSTSLQLDYARTIINSISDSPDPVTNASDQTFAITANWTTIENSPVSATCNATIFDNNYTFSFSDATNLYTITLSAAKKVDIYSYTVTCYNNSYQTQTAEGSVTITSGGGGTGPAGGGGGTTTVITLIATNETLQLFPSQLSGLASAGDTFIIKGIGADYSFRLKNIGSDDLSVTVGFFGEGSEWADLESIKIGGETKEFVSYKSTKESITIKPDQVANFNIEVSIPTATKDGTYSFLTAFTNTRTGASVSGETFVKVSKITAVFKYATNFISWFYQKLTWKFGISETGQPIENGFVFRGKVNLIVPFAGIIISITTFYIAFTMLTSGFILPYAKKRVSGVNFNIGVAILLSTGITLFVLGLLP